MINIQETITGGEFLALKHKGKTKYNNKKVKLDGHTFDSVLEADYYSQLKLLEKANKILFFRLQPRYLLVDAFEKKQKKYRDITYIADFEIHHLDGSIEVVDTKGVKTDVFRLKEKLFHKRYPHKLTIITKNDLRR